MEYQIKFQGTTNGEKICCDKSKGDIVATRGSKLMEKPNNYNVFRDGGYSLKNARIAKTTYVRK